MTCQVVCLERSQPLTTLEERVRRTIHQLNVLTRVATLEFALGVGKVVVDTLYDGDLSAWRSRARKDHALRALAASPDLPLSASVLYRALAIYELSRRNVQGMDWRHLGVSHLRAVLGLPGEIQSRLLATAEAESWSVARLEREVLVLRSPSRCSGGRKPTPACVKSIRRIFELTLPEALEGLDSLKDLTASDMQELVDKLGKARERLHRVERVLASGSFDGRSSRRSVMASEESRSLEN
ncbi:MAG TPA: hypothetical protein VKP30_15290 [Polyangiaceae bacterium]|nr:hypothetical protein [Polyangiaceae bacterium]